MFLFGQPHGRVENSSKPHPENDHYLSQTEVKGLYRYVGTLSPDQIKVTNRHIRDRRACPDRRDTVVCSKGVPMARGAP
jgi:hypothetical protein